jgi:hypothetical protein
MRWGVCDGSGFICVLSGRDGGRHEAPFYRPVEADNRQAGWLKRLFGTEEPVICEGCLRGQADDADTWLEDRIEEHGDENAEIRSAIHKVLGMIEEYRHEACEEDAHQNAPDEFWDSDGEDYEPFDPDLKKELAILKVFSVWMNLRNLALNAPRTFDPDENWKRQMGELKEEYHRLMDMLVLDESRSRRPDGAG